MKALLVSMCAFFTQWSMLVAGESIFDFEQPGFRGSLNLSASGDFNAFLPTAPGDNGAVQAPVIHPSALAERSLESKETRPRRFEIIFFISLPASVLFSFLGVLAYRGFSGRTGGFSPVEYQYLALSAVGISLSIAVSDSRAIYSRGYR